MRAHKACPSSADWAVSLGIALVSTALSCALTSPLAAAPQFSATGAPAPASAFLHAMPSSTGALSPKDGGVHARTAFTGAKNNSVAALPSTVASIAAQNHASAARPASFSAVPATTASLQPAQPSLSASLGTQDNQNSLSHAAPTSAPAPGSSTVVPPKPPGTGASGNTPNPIPTPGPAPTFAHRLHSALDALVADAKGPDAAEQKDIRTSIAGYYSDHGYAPLWLTDGKPNEAAKAVMDRLAHANDDGLSVDDLPAPDFANATDDEKLAQAEINLSMQVVAYGREASGSRVDPHRLAALIYAAPDILEPEHILGALAHAGADAGKFLQGFNPPQPGYLALREKLAELRLDAKPVAAQPIPPGPTLKVGMSDPRVPLIRVRFGLDPDSTTADTELLYDKRVADAVKQFQKMAGLPASGVLTARTVAALAGEPPARVEDVLLANMEMWRWLPRDLGKDRIEVNVPDFTVAVFRDDQFVTRHKVIVGKPTTPTPLFSNAMKFIIVNPDWNVPPSIIRKEVMPHLAQDPDYLSRMGFEVFSVHGHLVIRQPPGDRNALGRIKFMFPNPYSVYLHDTPTRGLFAASKRAFSHGCVRVENPFALAETVLGPDSGWSEEKVKRLVGGGERYIYLPEPLPIHIEYFTAFVDDDGHLQMRDDVYGYTRKVDVALGLAKPGSERQKPVVVEEQVDDPR
jgi:murein L,D-transpeptidase YcbB/YkuD